MSVQVRGQFTYLHLSKPSAESSLDMTADDPVLEFNIINYTDDEVWKPFRVRASELTNGVSTWEQKMDDVSRRRHQNVVEGRDYYAVISES